MTRKLGQVQRKQIKVDPDVHEEKARVEREIMLDLAQLALHFETQILELGSLRQYHWKINVSTENFGCWQRVNWPWPDKSLREWACKLWTPSGKKWTILETTKNRHSWPQRFLQTTNKNLWQQKVDVTFSKPYLFLQTRINKNQICEKKVDLTSSKADSSSLTCWSFVCSSLCFLFNTFKSKSESQNDYLQADCTSILISVSFTFFLRLSLSVSTPFEILNCVRSLSSFLSWLRLDLTKVTQHLLWFVIKTLYFSSSCENLSLAWPISFWSRA